MKNKIEIKKKLGHFKVWEVQANEANLARNVGKIGKLGREISFTKASIVSRTFRCTLLFYLTPNENYTL